MRAPSIRWGPDNCTCAIVASALPANREATKPPTLKAHNGHNAFPSYGQKEWVVQYFPAGHYRHANLSNLGNESTKRDDRSRPPSEPPTHDMPRINPGGEQQASIPTQENKRTKEVTRT